MNDQLRAIADLDRIIHEPGRMMIVALLAAVNECDFLYLQRETGLNKGNLSSHLAKLEEAGYVQIEKTYRGKVPQTLLRLTASGLCAAEAQQELFTPTREHRLESVQERVRQRPGSDIGRGGGVPPPKVGS